jgi:hypothetical protein
MNYWHSEDDGLIATREIHIKRDWNAFYLLIKKDEESHSSFYYLNSS